MPPKLGFFVGSESRIPYDFHEMLSCIAPRPILVIAPKLDKDAHHDDIKKCLSEVAKIYNLYGAIDNIQMYEPNDFNRLSSEMRDKMYSWLSEMLKK